MGGGGGWNYLYFPFAHRLSIHYCQELATTFCALPAEPQSQLMPVLLPPHTPIEMLPYLALFTEYNFARLFAHKYVYFHKLPVLLMERKVLLTDDIV